MASKCDAHSLVERAVDHAGIAASFPNDATYAEDAASFNRRFSYVPAGVTFPDNADQIGFLLQLAQRHGIHVTARGGGHSYTALGVSGGQDGALIIDVKNLSDISIDPTTHVATVQAGLHLGDLALSLNAAGRALPHGSCPFVGVAGHASLGGWGFVSRLWGLTLDHVVGIDAVLSNGTRVVVSQASYPDLFFAMRGAASSFGIVTAFHFATEPAPPVVTGYYITWDLTAEEAITQFGHLQNFVSGGIPATLGVEVTLFKGSTQGRVAFHFNGAFVGTQEDFATVVQPYLDTFPRGPSETKVNPTSWIDYLRGIAGSQNLNTTIEGKDYTDTFYTKSLMTHPLGDASTSAFFTYLSNEGFLSSTRWFVQIELYGGSNSKINEVPVEQTAFVNRDKTWTWQLYASSSNNQPPFPADGVAFVSGMASAIVDNEALDWPVGAYINYLDSELSEEEAQRLYYGSNYPRLSQLKSQYDPQAVFNFPSGIHGV